MMCCGANRSAADTCAASKAGLTSPDDARSIIISPASIEVSVPIRQTMPETRYPSGID